MMANVDPNEWFICIAAEFVNGVKVLWDGGPLVGRIGAALLVELCATFFSNNECNSTPLVVNVELGVQSQPMMGRLMSVSSVDVSAYTKS